MFKESPGVTLDITKDPLPGADSHHFIGPFNRETGNTPEPVRVGYRAFDRQWVIPDSRLMQRPGPLWHARIPGQVFTIEQHSQAVTDGPGIIFSSLIPDLHHFNNRGGRALPRLHPNGTPNVAPGVLEALSGLLGLEVDDGQFLAYVAGVVSHPAYTATFAEELSTPGIRVPVTSDPELFTKAIVIGEQIIWLHTYGQTYTSDERIQGNIRYPFGDPRQPLSRTPITSMPTGVRYDELDQRILLGGGELGPVSPGVWEYAVGGRNVLKSWVAYRKSPPGGKKTSPLDDVHTDTWFSDWTRELIDLLTVLCRLVDLEDEQASLLTDIIRKPTISIGALSSSGARWPTTPKDRKPDHQPKQSHMGLF